MDKFRENFYSGRPAPADCPFDVLIRQTTFITPRPAQCPGGCSCLAVAYFAGRPAGPLARPAATCHQPHLAAAPGIAVAALYRWGYGYWPAIFVTACILQEISFSVRWPSPAWLSPGRPLAPCSPPGSSSGAHFHPSFDRRRDIAIFAALPWSA